MDSRNAAEWTRSLELLRDLDPDVLHVHGLCFPRDVLSLASLAPGVPIILQDHANRPPRLWRRALWRRGMALAAGIAFCASDQAQPFAAAGLLDSATCLYEIPESTSRFSPGDKQAARAQFGLPAGATVLLCCAAIRRRHKRIDALLAANAPRLVVPMLRWSLNSRCQRTPRSRVQRR